MRAKTEIENDIHEANDELNILMPMMYDESDGKSDFTNRVRDLQEKLKVYHTELEYSNQGVIFNPEEEDMLDAEIEADLEAELFADDIETTKVHFYRDGGEVYSTSSQFAVSKEEMIDLANSVTSFDRSQRGADEINNIEGALSILRTKYPEYAELDASDFDDDEEMDQKFDDYALSSYAKGGKVQTDLGAIKKGDIDKYGDIENIYYEIIVWGVEPKEGESDDRQIDIADTYSEAKKIAKKTRKEIKKGENIVIYAKPDLEIKTEVETIRYVEGAEDSYGVGGMLAGFVVGGYAGYKYGLTKRKRNVKDLFSEEQKFAKDYKKRMKKQKEERKKRGEREYTDYEELKKGGCIDKYANGGKLNSVRVKFKNPKYDYSTSIGSNVSETQARKYFIGMPVNVASYPREKFADVVDIEYTKGGNYAKGGKTFEYDPNIDYFSEYELLPKDIYNTMMQEGELEDYQQTEKLLKKLEVKGWTFDFGLDNSPYGLRPIGAKTNLYAKGGVIGVKTPTNFKPVDLENALKKAKIEGYSMNRLSTTLIVLKVDGKDINDTKKIIDDLGLSVMMKKGGRLEGSPWNPVYTDEPFSELDIDRKIGYIKALVERHNDKMNRYYDLAGEDGKYENHQFMNGANPKKIKQQAYNLESHIEGYIDTYNKLHPNEFKGGNITLSDFNLEYAKGGSIEERAKKYQQTNKLIDKWRFRKEYDIFSKYDAKNLVKEGKMVFALDTSNGESYGVHEIEDFDDYREGIVFGIEKSYAKGGWIDFKSKREINKIKKELEEKGDTYSIQFDSDGSRFGLKGGGRYRITSGEHLSTTYAKGGKIYKIKNRRKFEKWYDEVSGWGGIDGDKWFMDDGIKIYGFADEEIRAEKDGKEVYIRDDIYEKYSNPDDADFKLDTNNLYAKGGKVLALLTLKDFQGTSNSGDYDEEIYDKVKERNGTGSVYSFEEKLTENPNRKDNGLASGKHNKGVLSEELDKLGKNAKGEVVWNFIQFNYPSTHKYRKWMKDAQDIENFDGVIGSTDKEATKHKKLIDKLITDKQLKKDWRADTGGTQQHWYEKGGALSKEFKFDKNFVIYVPSTSNVGEKISKSKLEKRVKEVEKFVANEFGGYTETDTDGGYKATSGEIIEEDIVKVSVFANNKDWKDNEKKVVSKVKKWAKKWGQEAIGFEYEGDLYYIDNEGKYAKGGKVDKMREKISSKYEIMMDSAYGAGSKIPVLRPKGGFGDGVIIDNELMGLRNKNKIHLLSSKSGRPIPGQYEFTDIDKAMVAATKYVDKYVDKYAQGGKIKKGDYVRDARGELGLVNKVKKGVAYVKYPSTNEHAFEPVFLDTLVMDFSTGYHKGKKVYKDFYSK